MTIEIPVGLWIRLAWDLRRRGQGRRESGAFLLGKLAGSRGKVTSFVCYDDIDPGAYDRGAIAFHAQGYAALWQHCRELKVELLADIHTHPGSDVRQSWVDQRNPMIPVVGHTALIMPNFGRARWTSLDGIGIYEYMGNFKWRARTCSNRVKITLW